MPQSSTSSERSYLRKYWLNLRRIRFWLVAVAILYTLVGFLVLPQVATSYAVNTVKDDLGRDLRIGSIHTNPFTLTIAVHDLALDDIDGQEFMGFERLYIDLTWSSLFKGTVVIPTARLDNGRVYEEQFESGETRFTRLLSDFQRRPLLRDSSEVTSQAINRLRFLDELTVLINNNDTLEKDMHKALEKNTWIIGDDYSLLFSDTNLKTAVKRVLDKKYKGEKQLQRPDLFLGRTISKRLLLIEFKRPNFTLTRETESQAQQYKDELGQYFGNQPIDIILLGGKIDNGIKDIKSDIKYLTYIDCISSARNRLEWMIDELKKE